MTATGLGGRASTTSPGRQGSDPDLSELIQETEAFLRDYPTGPETTKSSGHRGARTVLLPYSGSEQSACALDAMADLADSFAVSVRLLHIRQWDADSCGRFFLETRDEAVALTEAAMAWLRDRGIRSSGVVAQAARADVPRLIVQRANKVNAVAILLGARRKRGITAILAGSVSRQVIRTATRPVIVVHPSKEPDASRPRPPLLGDHGPGCA